MQLQPQRPAVTPPAAAGQPRHRNRTPTPVRPPLGPRQRRIVVAPSGMVKPPVFPYLVAGVNLPLHRVVPPPGTCRRHLQHKVRRLAHLADDVAVGRHNIRRRHGNPQRHQAIGVRRPPDVPRVIAQIAGTHHHRIGPSPQPVLQNQVRAGYVRVLYSHIGTLGRVGQQRQPPGRFCRSPAVGRRCRFGSHWRASQ